MPVRHRLVRWGQRAALAGLVATAFLALAVCWLAAHLTGGGVPVVALVAGLLVSCALAVMLARRSTWIVEAVFEREDEVMRAAVHEIRQPLSHLTATLEDGSDGVEPSEVALAEATAHTEALDRLLDDLVETARVLTGSGSAGREMVSLEEVVTGVAGAGVAGEATLELDLRPGGVVGSAALLRLAVKNLVRNAAHHAYDGGPGVIWVRVDGSGVQVADAGPGIAEEELAELRSRQVWVVGLRRARVRVGLPLAAWVATLHGGSLELAPRPGGGLVAHLCLPVETVRAGTVGRSVAAEVEGEVPS